MPTKVILTLALATVMGLGFSSCATVAEADRDPASEAGSRYAKAIDRHEEKIECNLGEERNDAGECERPYASEHPFHRGGR